MYCTVVRAVHLDLRIRYHQGSKRRIGKVIRAAAVNDDPLGTTAEIEPSAGYRNIRIRRVIDIYANVHIRQWYTAWPCFPARSCQ